MAGDWIKMRVSLRRDPSVATMADFLALERAFMDFVTDPARQHCKESVYEHIKSDVTRDIAVSSLLEVWGVARDRGDRDGEDLVLKHCNLANLDDICGVPCFGEAMEYVNWAVEECLEDAKGRAAYRVRFPKFFKDQEAPDQRYKKQHAEAQKRYRDGKKMSAEISAESDITSDITVTHRVEESREEKSINIKERKAGKKYSPFLPPEGVSLKIWEDFLTIRHVKKKPITETAIRGIEREAQKAGIDLEMALKICCESGWASFRADYMQGSSNEVKSHVEPGWRIDARRRMQEIAPSIAEKEPGARRIVKSTDEALAEWSQSVAHELQNAQILGLPKTDGFP